MTFSLWVSLALILGKLIGGGLMRWYDMRRLRDMQKQIAELEAYSEFLAHENQSLRNDRDRLAKLSPSHFGDIAARVLREENNNKK